MKIEITDDVIVDVDDYVSEALSLEFSDVTYDGQLYKGMQPRNNDQFQKFMESNYPDYNVAWNFIRRSPIHQEEPNFIHSDDVMGDLTALLYLNKHAPDNDGTTIYSNDEKPMCVVKSSYNRCLVFPAYMLHARNLFDNFGEGDKARLVQVIFLKQKAT